MPREQHWLLGGRYYLARAGIRVNVGILILLNFDKVSGKALYLLHV